MDKKYVVAFVILWLIVISIFIYLLIYSLGGGLMLEIIILLKVIGSIGLLGLAFIAGRTFTSFEVMKREIDEIKDQLQRKRHTYATNDGLEDALAVVAELMVREEMQSDYRYARLQSAKDILGIIRSGPLKYDSDRPNKRPAPPE